MARAAWAHSAGPAVPFESVSPPEASPALPLMLQIYFPLSYETCVPQSNCRSLTLFGIVELL